MKKALKRIMSGFLVALMLLSIAPMSEIAKIDFPSLFSSMAYAVGSSLKLGCKLEEITIVSSSRGNGKIDDSWGTNATDESSINLTAGDTLELKINVKKKDENGNVVDAEPGEFPAISWSASPADSVELSVNSGDTRYCSIKVVSDKVSPIYIYASMSGQTKTFTINIASLTFDKNKYYILVDDTDLVSDFEFDLFNSCFAIWVAKDSEISPEGFKFTSSDESILKINGKGNYSVISSIQRKYYFYPDVYGVKEGEVTLTIEAPDGQTDTCTVVVVGYKEYLLEVYSKDLEIPLKDADVTYTVVREGQLSSQAQVTAKTGEDGIVKVKIPDAKFYKQDIIIKPPAHKDIEISTEFFQENTINRQDVDFEILIENPDLGSATISGPTEEVDNESFSLFDFSGGIDFGKHSLQYDIDTKENTVEFLFGFKEEYLNTDKNWGDCYDTAKTFYESIGKSFYPKGSNKNNIANNAYKKLHEKLKNNKYNFLVTVEGSVFGFGKFDYSTGKLVPIEGGALLTASLDFEKQVPWFAAVYVKFGFGVTGEAKFKLVYEDAGEFYFGLDINFDAHGHFGIGIGCEAIGIDVNAEIKLNIEIRVNKNIRKIADALRVYFSGSVYLEGHVEFWKIKLKAKLVKWDFPRDLELFPDPGLKTNSYQDPDFEVKFELIDRNYLLSDSFYTNSVIGENLLKENVYPYGEPQIVSLDDGRLIAVWLEDDGKKTAPNATTIQYSIFANGGWSVPAVLCDSGRADHAPKLVSDGNNAYLLWQRNSKVLDVNVSFDEYLMDTELVYSYFNGSKWSTPVVVANGDNNQYESLYSIAAQNGKVLVSWVENSTNDFMLINGQNTICKQTISGTTLGKTETVAQTQNRIYSLASGFKNGKSFVAYCADNDGDIKTYDAEMFFDGKNITNDQSNDVVLTYQNDTIYWLKDGMLCYYDSTNDKVVITDLHINSNNYSVIKNGNSSAVVFDESTGYYSELVVSYLNDNSYSKPVVLSNYGGKIDTFDAVMKKDGTIVTSSNVRNVDLELDEGVYSTTDFHIDDFDSTVNVSVSDVWYDMNQVIPGETLILHTTISNEGTEPIDKYVISVGDEVKKEVSTITKHNEILPGESIVVDVEYKVDHNFEKRRVLVKVDAEENVSTENEFEVVVGYSDLVIVHCDISSEGKIEGLIENVGFDATDNVLVNIYYINDEKILLDTINIGSVSQNQEIDFDYLVDKKYLTTANYLEASTFEVEVTTEVEEADYSNNSIVVKILPVRVEDIELDENSIVLTPNSTWQMGATITPANTATKTVYWFSDNPEIASVDENGKITAHKFGTTTITAVSSDGRYEDYCEVAVSDKVPVTGISLSLSQSGLMLGETLKLTASVFPVNATNKLVTWSSNNTAVATVSSSGVVSSKAVGTAIITAKTADGKSASCVITVTEAVVSVTGISLTPPTATIKVGEKLKLQWSIVPSNATNQSVVWSSDNESVATVSSTGEVIAKKTGKATITVTTVDGAKKATSVITVTETTVEKKILSISVATQPNKTEYIYKNESFDKSGMSIQVKYTDGSTEIISDTSAFNVSSIPNKKGNHSLVVEYEGFETTVNVTVKYAWWQWIIIIVLFGWIWY